MVIVVFKWFYINSFFTVYFVAWDDSILLYCFISAWYYQHSIIISNCLEYIPISPFWGVIYLFSVGQSSIISWWNPAVILRPNLPRWHLPARSWFTTPVVHYFFSDIYHKPTLSLETNLANLGINHQSHVLCGLTHHLTVADCTVNHRKWSGSPIKPVNTAAETSGKHQFVQLLLRILPGSVEPRWCPKKVMWMLVYNPMKTGSIYHQQKT